MPVKECPFNPIRTRVFIATIQPTKQCKTTWLVWYYYRLKKPPHHHTTTTTPGLITIRAVLGNLGS